LEGFGITVHVKKYPKNGRMQMIKQTGIKTPRKIYFR